ncbi:hypothetical protein ACE6H2_010879 [Prunus campanulata]
MLVQTIRYLLSLAVIRAEANAVNGMFLITLDVLEHSIIAREEFSTTTQEIQPISTDSGINNENDHAPPPPVRPLQRLMECFEFPNKWLEEMRGLVMVVATVISTMTFQAVVNPPGGVWQENNTNSSILFKDQSIKFCSEENVCVAGTAVLGYTFASEFLDFIKFNTISFLASMSVTLLLVSGFPLHNQICTWLLLMAMCVTLTFMALTYLKVLLLVVPFGDLFNSSFEIYEKSFKIWIGLLVMVSVMHTIRFLIWVVKKLRPAYFRSGLPKIISSRSFSRNA